MALSSGVFPYDYTHYPWQAPVGGTLPMSGSPIEEAMWVACAEIRRYIGTNPPVVVEKQTFSSGVQFQNYFHVSGVPGRGTYNLMARDRSNYSFEPSINAVHVGSGQVNTTDWIYDLRQALSGIVHPDNGYFYRGLLTWIGHDTEFNNNTYFGSNQQKQYIEEWLLSKFDDGVTWKHDYYTTDGTPPYGLLGTSGILYDRDLDEVMYQPFPRFNQIDEIFVETQEIDIYSPIFPIFAKPDGNLISLTSVDSSQDFFDYGHVGSGLVKFEGDVLTADASYAFGNQSGTMWVQGHRPLGGDANAQFPVTRVFIDPPAEADVNPAPVIVSMPGQIPASGFRVSRFPIFDGYQPQQLDLDGATSRPSGFEWIADSLWSVGNRFTRAAGDFGIYTLLSPFTGLRLWGRFAENELAARKQNGAGGPHDDINAYNPRDVHQQSSYILANSGAINVDNTTTSRAIWWKFDNNLNLTSSATTTLGIGNQAWGDSFWFDGTYVYVIAKRLSISFFILRIPLSTLASATIFTGNNIDAGWGLADIKDFTPSNDVGFFDGTNNYIASSNGSVGKLTFNVGTSQFDIGAPEAISSDAFPTITGNVQLQHVERVTSATTITPGLWILATESGGGTNKFVGRMVRIPASSSWSIVEHYGIDRKYHFTINDLVYIPL